MKNDELNKLIDNSLDRLSEKAKIQKHEAEKKALILPSAKTVIRIGIIIGLIFAFCISLYYYDIKAPLFTLAFWSFPLLTVYMMFSIVVNYDRDIDIEKLFNLMVIYATASIVGFYYYKKFIVYILSIDYQIAIPFFNYTLQLI